MGALPPFKVLGEIKTVRGKRGQKHYSVFVADLARKQRDAWAPALNSEHSQWLWVPVANLSSVPLHPVVDLLIRPEGYQPALLACLKAAAAP